MSNRSQNYEELYGVGLLDDLHNYFPALLYDPDSFQSVREVLRYISTQTRRRFDLYSFGLTAYEENSAERTSNAVGAEPTNAQGHQFYRNQAQSARTSPLPNATVNQTMGRPATVQRPGVYQTYLFDLNETPRNSVISPGMMTSLLAGLQPRQGNDMAALTTLASLLLRGEDAFIPPNLEPVVVRPTLQQIARATRVGTPEGEHDCAICQDAITNTQQCREILHCHHWFHQDCIDPWFRQNVQCPICRFDIRQHNVVNPEDTDGEADVES